MKEVDKLKRQWAKSDDVEINSAITALLEHRHGRRLLWWLLQEGRWATQPYSGNALNTAFSCGELNVGQKIADRILSVGPEGFLNMMKESQDERTVRDSLLGDAADRDTSSYAEPDADSDA